MPQILYTFFELYAFSGKTVIPFSTHEGSSLGTSMNDIKRYCFDAEVKEGLAIFGSNASNCKSKLEEWI